MLFSENSQILINSSIKNYRRFAGIEISFSITNNNQLDIFIAQYRLVNKKTLTDTELIDRASEVFNLPETPQFNVTIHSQVFVS